MIPPSIFLKGQTSVSSPYTFFISFAQADFLFYHQESFHFFLVGEYLDYYLDYVSLSSPMELFIKYGQIVPQFPWFLNCKDHTFLYTIYF